MSTETTNNEQELHDQQIINNSIINEYRQALADVQFLLAKSNAAMKVKDEVIADLRGLLEGLTPLPVAAPKPGPPPAH